MHDKIIVGLIFGGRSAEHEVSIMSARNVAAALDPEKYLVRLIGITKSGAWLFDDAPRRVIEDPTQQILPEQALDTNPMVALSAHQSESSTDSTAIDVIFPVLHGPYGEDGTVQGLAKILDLPCVGAGVIGSVLGMDKDVMKRLLVQAKIPIVEHIVLRHGDKRPNFDQLSKKLGQTLFVKPANLGSSVGVSKVTSQQELSTALDTAFRYDRKIIIEQGLNKVREIEIGVLGNDQPEVSVPGELMVADDFYSYDAKYGTESQTKDQIPAQIPKKIVAEIEQLAQQTFQVLECRGMCRADFFLTAEGKIYLNEINTLPGFTNISMYPKLWEASGMSQRELVDRLIALAMEEGAQY
ncbi:MAG: D-alanine--D-alanine ligase family protein [Patescibacteria group bacterium]